jgi:magnesium-transporting ATPase (P-type)
MLSCDYRQPIQSTTTSQPSRDQKNDDMEESQQQFPSELTTTFYTSEVSKLAAHFRSSAVNGLCEEVAAVRLKCQGLNIVELNKETPMWIQFIRCFCDPFSLLLWIAAGLMLINWLVFPLRFSSNYYLVVIALLLLAIVATGLSVFWRVSEYILLCEYF